jgi:hypothetical protein
MRLMLVNGDGRDASEKVGLWGNMCLMLVDQRQRTRRKASVIASEYVVCR